MNERRPLFWGLVIGLVGNLLVSTAFALLEHPEWALFLNPMYILSWIAFVAFCSILLFGRDKGKTKAELTKADTTKNKDKEKPDIKSLIAEYQVLNDTVNRRYSDNLLVESIMIPISLAIVTFAIVYRTELGTKPFGLPNAGFIPLLSLILVFFLYFSWYTTKKINDISFSRLRQIEEYLRIKGHSYVRELTKDKPWFKVRWLMWHLFFMFFIIVSLFTAYWLFRLS